MTDNNFIESVAAYFKTDQWQRLMTILNKTDEPIYHVHVYIDTNLNPLCVEQLLKHYFAKAGHPISRKIEIFTSGQIIGSGTIHGVEPKGLPHFDMVFRYSSDLPIKATNKEDNVEFWGKHYMDNFHGQYDLKTTLTPAQEKDVDAYFHSKAWEDYCSLNESSEVVHIHGNVETSIHPDLIRAAGLKAMKQRGWEIDYAVPVAFRMRGQMHGKVVFGGLKPEKMFDIAWGFNPTVTLIPSTKYWLTTDNPTYDARTMREIPLLLKKDNYRLLSLAEMEAVAALV
jgi:hypothetical protein